MAKEPKKLDELFHDTLKDIYFAEKKILATLPKMAKAADSEELKAAFEKHHGETEGQIERLEQVFAAIDKKPQGKTCAAIVGITDEGAEIMQEYKGSPALDAGLLAAAQAVEHYEISRYGTLIAWAEELGLEDACRFSEETLDEEEATDEALTEIARAPSISRPKPPDGLFNAPLRRGSPCQRRESKVADSRVLAAEASFRPERDDFPSGVGRKFPMRSLPWSPISQLTCERALCGSAHSLR